MDDADLCNYGLSDIRKLDVFKIKELDLGRIPILFPELRSLALWGKPGIINNLKALEKLPFLRELIISDLFGFSAADMKFLERIPELRGLDLYSIPKEAGMAVKKTWKGKLDYLAVKRLRSDDWLKENLENPFRDWDGSEFVPAAAYKKTIQQYKKTKKQLEQLYEQFLKDKNLIDLDEFLNVLDEIRDEW